MATVVRDRIRHDLGALLSSVVAALEQLHVGVATTLDSSAPRSCRMRCCPVSLLRWNSCTLALRTGSPSSSATLPSIAESGTSRKARLLPSRSGPTAMPVKKLPCWLNPCARYPRALAVSEYFAAGRPEKAKRPSAPVSMDCDN